jgi:adenine-specific DNA-methyltransferase
MTESAGLVDPPSAVEPYRPVHYLGGKGRLLDQIEAAVRTVDPGVGPVVDLFSGSGVVSEALGQTWPIAAVDIQEYARVLVSAMAAPARLDVAEIAALVDSARGACAARLDAFAPLIEIEDQAIAKLEVGDAEPFATVIEAGSVAAFERVPGIVAGDLGRALGAVVDDKRARAGSIIARTYGGVYFSYRQAAAFDAILTVAHSLPDEERRNTMLAAAFGVAGDAVTSVGSHFAQPMRPRDKDGDPKVPSLRAAARRRRRDIFELFGDRLRRLAATRGVPHEVEAIRADYRAFLDSTRTRPSVVYADPPYTRDHYSRFYHVLETMALGDDPGLSEVSSGGDRIPSRGLYRQDRHQSPFCIASQVGEAFDALFAGVRSLDASLVLSYSPYESGTAARPQPRLLRIGELTRMAAAHFGRVEVQTAGELKHSKFNNKSLNGLALAEAEALIVCAP